MISFMYGPQSDYDNLPVIDEDALYCITDNRRIYKGSYLLTAKDVVFLNEIPDTPEKDYLYVITDSDNISRMYALIDDSFKQLGGGEATDLADGAVTFTKINSSVISNDFTNPSSIKIPTTQSVFEYINSLYVVATPHEGDTPATYVPEGIIENGIITVKANDTTTINEIRDVGSLTDGTYIHREFDYNNEALVITSDVRPTQVVYTPPTYETKELSATQSVSVFKGVPTDLSLENNTVVFTQVEFISSPPITTESDYIVYEVNDNEILFTESISNNDTIEDSIVFTVN